MNFVFFQIVSEHPGEISWRILSCYCSAPHGCTCFAPQNVTFQQESVALSHPPAKPSTSTNLLQHIKEMHEGLIGKWCAVVYDGDPYPGIIQNVDADSGAHVKTMSNIGINRFFWPMRDDMIWYQPVNVLGLIPEPMPVTQRHMGISPPVWQEICQIINQ